MAETLTYDPSNDTTTLNEEGLTPEEQDSLKVGEEMAEKESQLLAGKYKDAEELEKAYVELQKKLGEKGDETSETTGDTETTDSKEDNEKEKEVKEDSPAVALINEASAEYYANDNKLSPETIEKFSSMSSQDLVNAYLELQQGQPAQEQATSELSEGDINAIQNSVGGEAEYKNIVTWASENLDKNSIAAFDNIVDAGNKDAIQLAINGLKSQYENVNGYEGRMLTGKGDKTSSDVFRSQAELLRAMNDPRYDDDPAYRMDVIEKLDRSDVNF